MSIRHRTVPLVLLCQAALAPALAAQGVPPDIIRADSAPPKRARPTVHLSGYLQVFYKARRDANGDGITEPSVFRDQRVRIGINGKVTDHVGYDIEIDPRAPEVAGILRDAFITLDYLPHHEVRIGQQKTLFGYENPTSSSRLYTVNRSEVSDNLSRGVNLRDIGLGLTGWVRVNETWRIEDAVTVVNGAGMNVQADSTRRKNVWGRLGVRYRHGEVTVRLGLSAASGDQQEPADTGPPPVAAYTTRFTRNGADLEIDHPRLFVAAEYVTSDDKAPASIPDASGRSNGYYLIAVGKLRHSAGALLRYDVLEEFQRWTIGAYVGRPADPVSLLINYEIFQDDLGTHDDRYYARLQVRF